MFKFLLTSIIAAIALPSAIGLIALKTLDNLMLLTTLSINIISLLMIFYIQSIGWNIYTYILLFLLLNNILLSISWFIFNNLPLQSRIKEYFGKFIAFYLKLFYVYPNYFFRNLSIFMNKVLEILNNSIHSKLSDLLVIEPLKLIGKEFDGISKSTVLTFENNRNSNI
jgi:hypothetical protein